MKRFLIDDQGRIKKKLKPLSICPTLRSETHGNEPKVVESLGWEKWEGEIDKMEEPIKLKQIGFIEKNSQGSRIYDSNGLSATVASQTGGLGGSGGGLYLVEKNIKKGEYKVKDMKKEKNACNNSFTYVSLFSGVGGFEQALNKLGGKCVLASEIDKFANKAYEVLYGHETVGDITQVDTKDVPDHDLLVGGFPCFPAGQRVITKNGFKNIEDITSEDYVLTHKGRYQKVITPMNKLYNGDLYEITMKYYRLPIKVTSEHPFFTKRGWIEAKDLAENDYVGFPLNKESRLPSQLKYRKKINQSKEIEVVTTLPYEEEAFWKLIGYWLADGWTQDKRIKKQGVRNAYRILLAMNDVKEKFLLPLLDELKINYTVSQERTCKKVHIVNQELWLFIKQFTKGNRASNKFLPEFIQDLPINLAKSLIEGYKVGDGSTANGSTQFTSTSVELLEGIQRLLLKTDKRLYSLQQSHKEGKTTFEGREISTKNCYMLRGGGTQGGCVDLTENYAFFKIDKIRKEKVENLPVYNIEVEEDNSYCLPLVAVHNCQAFSVAGKRLGFEDTRGTLFFEMARIAKEKQPKVILAENVKGLVNHDKGRTLNVMIQTLCDIGYTVDFTVLNSKYFGVPQNRERVFIVAVRNDLITPEPWKIEGNTVVPKAKKRIQDLEGVRTFNFDWPEQREVTTRLRDVLEPKVGEKYYLSEEKTARLITQLTELYPVSLKTHEPNMIGHVDVNGHDYLKRVYDPNCISPALTTMNGGNKEPKIAIEEAHPILTPDHKPKIIESKEKDIKKVGYIESDKQQNRAHSVDGIMPTITANNQGGRRSGSLILEENKEDKINNNKNVKTEQFSMGDGVSNCIDANYYKGLSNIDIGKEKRTHVVEQEVVKYNRKNEIGKELNVAHTLNSSDWRGLNRNQKQNAVIEEVRPVLTPDRETKRQNGRRFKENDEESFTLTTQDRHGVAIGIPPKYRIRKLTPRECFRLQGFADDEFNKLVDAGISDSQLYKMAGNAVTVNVVCEIGKRLIKYIK